MSYDFSICIPVYNCANFLGEALDSVLAQEGPSFEIVVFDGGSTDQTPELLRGYQARHSIIRYVRASSRGGIDADMASCAALGNGTYLWLLSGDDVMRPGALRCAALHIQNNPDVIICRHSICSIDMTHLQDYPVMVHNRLISAELSRPTDRLRWFQAASTTEALFSFMSSLIIKRETWASGELLPAFTGSCWAHAARLMQIAQQRLLTVYVPEIWIAQRSGNDSFMSGGTVNRYRIAIEGYPKIVSHFFGTNSQEAFHCRRLLRREFSFGMFLIAKIHCDENPDKENRQLLNQLFNDLHIDKLFSNIVKKVIWLSVSAPVARNLRKFSKKLREIKALK